MGKVDHKDTKSAPLTAEISLLQSKWEKKKSLISVKNHCR